MVFQSIGPMMPLGIINPITTTSIDAVPSVGSRDGAYKAGEDFSKFLSDALGQVDALQKKADIATLDLATGKIQDMSEVMVALEKASLSLSLAVATRDKMIDAYNQVIRMQI